MHLSNTLRQALPNLAKPIILFSPSSISAPYIRPLDPRPSRISRGLDNDTKASKLHDTVPSASHAAHSIGPDDFQLYPDFFSLDHTRQLLSMSLAKLDGVDSVVKRRKRMIRQGKEVGTVKVGEGVQGLFDQEYDFQEGHYDSVIHYYRESLLSTFPPLTASSTWPDYQVLMARIYALLPTTHVSDSPYSLYSTADPSAAFPPSGSTTHVLHLAPQGQIQAHVDNVDASGSVIIGVSLGSTRILRLREKRSVDGRGAGRGIEGQGEGRGWDVLLPNGSLYLQRDSVRYQYEHSILSYDDPDSHWNGQPLERGHRLSLMVRERASQPAS